MKKKRCIKLFWGFDRTVVTVSRYDSSGEWVRIVRYTPSVGMQRLLAEIVYDRLTEKKGFLRPFLGKAPGWIYYEV